jgi:spore germination protein GerM
MRRLFSLLILLLLLCGCTQPQDNTCRFYYLRTAETIRYGQKDALVAPITRSISDQEADLDYLLQLYLDGPTEEGYFSPIPKGTYLLSTVQEADRLTLVFSREFSALDNMGLTLAGACLAATCHDLTGVQRITVRSGDSSFEFNLQNFTFLDGTTGH